MQASPFRPLTLRHPSPFPYIVFAGPCSAETEAQTLATAERCVPEVSASSVPAYGSPAHARAPSRG